MEDAPVCPRCGAPVRDGRDQDGGSAAWSVGQGDGGWTCARHGSIDPLQPFEWPGVDVAQDLVAQLAIPMWLPWPLPPGWLVSGLGYAGRDPVHATATVLACSGPCPVGGLGELLIVAEEPSVGLGSAYAGLSEVDPGATFEGTAAQAKVEIGQHLAALWCLSGPSDRAVYVGEAAGRWLWIVLHPASTGYLLAERLALTDLRDLGAEIQMLPFGAQTPRLRLDQQPPPGAGDAAWWAPPG